MFYVYLPHDIESILVATEAEKELLESIGMSKESCWADDDADAAVDRWTKIIRNGKQVFFEAEFSIDFEARTGQVEGPTIPAIGEPSNNADSGEAHADSVEAPEAEALKAMEGRLMNAFPDAMKELKDEVKSLWARVDGMSGDNPSNQVRVSDKKSEEDGDDKESEEEDGGDKESEEDVDDYILLISNQVQLEHGSGDDDMDDTLVIYAEAEKLENKMSEKAKTEKAKTEKTKSVKTKTAKKKKKRARTDDGKEVVLSKKAKDCHTVRSPIGTTRHKMEEEAAQKRTRGEKKKAAAAEKAAEKKQKKKADEKADEKAAEKKQKKKQKKKGAEEAAKKKSAEKKAAQKKATQKKAKKGGKKTV
ncbi:hypothetical protein Bca101_059789 [Brassica carinata]